MNIQTTKTIDAALALLDPKLAALVMAAMHDMIETALLHEMPKAIKAEIDARPAKLHLGITAANIWEIYGLPPSARGPAMLGRRLIEQRVPRCEAKIDDKSVTIFDPQSAIKAMKEGGLLEHFKKPLMKRRPKASNVIQLRPSKIVRS